MISKRKLKERLLDICAGAGMYWDADCRYFNTMALLCESVGSVIIAIEHSFFLGNDSIVRWPENLKCYEDIDEMVDLVFRAIEINE